MTSELAAGPAACSHLLSASCRPPRPGQMVYKVECTQCFDSVDSPYGIDVCLSCFNGGCASKDREHGKVHAEKIAGHTLALNIRRHVGPRSEPKPKLTKLEIRSEMEEESYEYEYALVCNICTLLTAITEVPNLQTVVDSIIAALSSAQQTQIEAWSLELSPCEHTLLLNPGGCGFSDLQLETCARCNLTKNLWLCLECGHVGCGRKQFGNENASGNGHGLTHFSDTGHGVSVKLGSITAEGHGDVYCYICNEDCTDPNLEQHLTYWGINIASLTKTEKSLTELNVEQNLQWNFTTVSDDETPLKPICGPGLTGLKNLGNSCYISSTLQSLFSLSCFSIRYQTPFDAHARQCRVQYPSECLECQMNKLADGLLSGRYSQLVADSEPGYQRGLEPTMFKALVGRDHSEFRSMKQQDASEFLIYLLKILARQNKYPELPDPHTDFRFILEERLKCLTCNKVRYRTNEQDNLSLPVRIIRSSKHENDFETVSLKDCFDELCADQIVDYVCPACSGNRFSQRTRFKTYPQYFIITVRRFELQNWVPVKVAVPIVVSPTLRLDDYLSEDPLDSEIILPDDDQVRSDQCNLNEAIVEELMQMGLSREQAVRATKATGNDGIEAATAWHFDHMDDPITNDSNLTDKAADENLIPLLMDMGFTSEHVKRALVETDNDVERAADWLFSHPDDGKEIEKVVDNQFSDCAIAGSDLKPADYIPRAIICHKGTNVHAGHYVAFVNTVKQSRKNNKEPFIWALFNDDKVLSVSDELEEGKRTGYVYILERKFGS